MEPKHVFYSCDLHLDLVTLILDLDLDILKMYLYTKNELSGQGSQKFEPEEDRHRQMRPCSVLKSRVVITHFIIFMWRKLETLKIHMQAYEINSRWVWGAQWHSTSVLCGDIEACSGSHELSFGAVLSQWTAMVMIKRWFFGGGGMKTRDWKTRDSQKMHTRLLVR